MKSFEACQFHAKQIHQPTQGHQTIPLLWPFAVWGLDILGPFPRASGGYRYLHVVVDKFTKWAEVEAVRTIPAGSAVKFIKGAVSESLTASSPTTARSSLAILQNILC